MIETGQFQKSVSAKELDTAAYVGRAAPDDRSVCDIRQFRGYPFDPGILSILTPSHYDRRRGGRALRRTEQNENVGGIVLPVAVKSDDPLSPCGAHAG